jgi:hypothetical protein
VEGVKKANTCAHLPHSVKDYLKETMMLTRDSITVSFLVIKNYCYKMRLLYIYFLNEKHVDGEAEDEDIVTREALLKIKFLLNSKDQIISQASQLCINELCAQGKEHIEKLKH